MNVENAIAVAEGLIRSLNNVADYALVGSATYLPYPNDIDFAVLLTEGANAIDYVGALSRDKFEWELCGDYDGVDGKWHAVRKGNLNLIITHDPKFFTGFKIAMEVCKALRLVHKMDRIAVCQIVRDGRMASEVVTHYGEI